MARPLRYRVTLMDPDTGKVWIHSHATEEAALKEATLAAVQYGMFCEVAPVMSVREKKEAE